MIVFNNWTITVTGLIARQYDNLSRRIDVEGNLPAGYTWQLLVQSGGNADTILLEATETGAGAVLTADNLSRAGEYYIQLRGILEADGVTRRHTNVVNAYIPESLTGIGTWPEVPTEFSQVEARILELYQHPPIPGSNGYWLVWDTDKGEYVESQLSLPDVSVGPPGAAGFSPTVSLTETADGVRIDVTDQEGTESATIKNGQDGAPGKDGADGLPGKDGKDGDPGADGKDGVGIQSVTQTTASTEDGGTNIVTVTKTDGTTSTFEVRNGSRGSTGPAGADGKNGQDGSQGPAGADGKTAYQYAQEGGYAGTEQEFAEKLAAEIPSPYTLPVASPTVLGGVQPVAKTEAMTQSVGVDEAGALWTAAGGGGTGKNNSVRLIRSVTVPEDITTDTSGVTWLPRDSGGCWFGFDTDENGNPFEVTELFVVHNNVTFESGELIYKLNQGATPSYGRRAPNMSAYQPKVNRSWQWMHALGLFSTFFGCSNNGGSFSGLQAPRYLDVNPISSITSISCFINNGNKYGLLTGTITFYGR